MISDYEEYCITEQYDPWGYGVYPNEPALLTRAGYRELLRCITNGTGGRDAYAELLFVAGIAP